MRARRSITIALVAAAVVAGGVALASRQRTELAPAPADNPGGYVASDVARLAATGRPQLVEVFHYG